MAERPQVHHGTLLAPPNKRRQNLDLQLVSFLRSRLYVHELYSHATSQEVLGQYFDVSGNWYPPGRVDHQRPGFSSYHRRRYGCCQGLCRTFFGDYHLKASSAYFVRTVSDVGHAWYRPSLAPTVGPPNAPNAPVAVPCTVRIMRLLHISQSSRSYLAPVFAAVLLTSALATTSANASPATPTPPASCVGLLGARSALPEAWKNPVLLTRSFTRPALVTEIAAMTALQSDLQPAGLTQGLVSLVSGAKQYLQHAIHYASQAIARHHQKDYSPLRNSRALGASWHQFQVRYHALFLAAYSPKSKLAGSYLSTCGPANSAVFYATHVVIAAEDQARRLASHNKGFHTPTVADFQAAAAKTTHVSFGSLLASSSTQLVLSFVVANAPAPSALSIFSPVVNSLRVCVAVPADFPRSHVTALICPR